MKRLFVLVLALCLLPVACSAEVDLSGLSFDELLALRSRVEMEILARPEWREVVVPTGDWVVGVHIPSGDYSVRAVSYGLLQIRSADGRSVFSSVIREGEHVGRFVIEEGWTVHVEKDLIFAPAIGLGF